MRGGGVAAGSSPTIGHNPVTTYTSCDVRVNGTVVASSDILQSGVVTESAEAVMFDPTGTDHVQVCDNVQTWDAHGQRTSSYVCHETTRTTALPQELIGLLCTLLPALCPFLGSNTFSVLTSLPG